MSDSLQRPPKRPPKKVIERLTVSPGTEGPPKLAGQTATKEGMDPKYAGWDATRRMRAAAEHVIWDKWTQTEAARVFGVNRSNLNQHVKKLREKKEARIEQARAEQLERATGVRVENEKRRIMPFWDFEEKYFSGLKCGDCGIRHEAPDVHREIIDLFMSGHPRIGVNIGPYHSKTTLVSVKHTLYDIASNPNSRTLIVSKSGAFARLILGSITEFLTNPELYADSPGNLIEEWGPFVAPGLTWNQDQIFVAGRITQEKDPTVQVVGLGGQVYGRRADKIKFDDIADTENQRNPEQVKKQLEWIDKTALSRIGKSGQAGWLGTRVNAGDIYSFLMKRDGYQWVRYPTIIDDENELTLWPEHFPYSQAIIHRAEMAPADFSLIYQNIDTPELGSSFPPEVIEACKDSSRSLGHYEPGWRLVAGLDPAGASKNSGYTAMIVQALDPMSGRRYLVDIVNVRSMKAPHLKDTMLDLSDKYPLGEWRVENNGVQAQLIQYDDEMRKQLTARGIRITGHTTTSLGKTGKWDPQFGVESMAPLWHNGMISVPWADEASRRAFAPLVEQLAGFPMAVLTDTVMALWFSELSIRELVRRQAMPMFGERKVPEFVRRRRKVIDLGAGRAKAVPLAQQRPGQQAHFRNQYQRLLVGKQTPYSELAKVPEPVELRKYVNVEGTPGD